MGVTDTLLIVGAFGREGAGEKWRPSLQVTPAGGYVPVNVSVRAGEGGRGPSNAAMGQAPIHLTGSEKHGATSACVRVHPVGRSYRRDGIQRSGRRHRPLRRIVNLASPRPSQQPHEQAKDNCHATACACCHAMLTGNPLAREHVQISAYLCATCRG